MLYPIEQYIPQGDSQLISSSLLWEYDLTDFDWDKSKCIVVERVIERGRPEDYRGAINRYGGIENFRAIMLQTTTVERRTRHPKKRNKRRVTPSSCWNLGERLQKSNVSKPLKRFQFTQLVRDATLQM